MIPNQTIVATCKATSCNLYLPTCGHWAITATAYGNQASWDGAQLYINGVLVDQNFGHGDQAGTGYGVLTGTYLGVLGPSNVTTTTSFGSSWGDNTISLLAVLSAN